MNKDGAAKQGEQTCDRNTLVIKATWGRSGGCVIKELRISRHMPERATGQPGASESAEVVVVAHGYMLTRDGTWNVDMHSQCAGERVMALLPRMYAKLHLSLNEAKSTVTSVFGRRFLGIRVWGCCVGKLILYWRKRQKSAEHSMNGPATGSELFISSIGSVAKPCSVNCALWRPVSMLPLRWWDIPSAGGTGSRSRFG